ncbi:hypothetical protein [Pseudomonas hunanensis]|uniref:hypothetical protein n=1 Tax=Pseudomonas hunanensis TaxID=1247546 RepID=UPI0015B9AD50|nr:hypothetical protein [Pseudomonas hunanensis]NWL08984.1 hypothetical protein [Pseudomonas hunanensis]
MNSKSKLEIQTEKIKKIIISKSNNPEYIRGIENLTPDQIRDWHSINYGFEGISELDSIVIRGDILIERAIRSLAGAIAKNPIPSDMTAAGIKRFIDLMEPLDQDYIKAMKILNKARNTIAHEVHEDYVPRIHEILKIVGLTPSENLAFDLQACIIVIIATISNRREHLLSKK